MNTNKKQYKVIAKNHKVVFTGGYCEAMDQVVLAKNAIIVSVIGDWVIAQSKRGVFSVINESYKYAKPSIVYRSFIVTFTALESFYGAATCTMASLALIRFLLKTETTPCVSLANYGETQMAARLGLKQKYLHA